MTPTIAVVIPNRNDSKHLKTCLDSVLAQNVLPDQIIVVDDQSTDDSLTVIQARLLDVANAKILVNETCLGTMGALNEGLKHVTCDYVLFLSSNDYLENGIFDHAKSCIESAGSPGVWSAMVWQVDEAGENRHLYPSPVVAPNSVFLPPDKCVQLAMSVGHWFTGTTLIYRREALKEIGGFDPAYEGMADLLAALTIASLYGASFSPEPLGVVRQHAEGCMWRTLTNLQGLDAILAKMQREGPRLSPTLFNPEFCELTQRRIRFTAIRASRTKDWLPHSITWPGHRYQLLNRVCRFFGWWRTLQLALAFLILRPLSDIATIIWYRIFGALFVMVRRSA